MDSRSIHTNEITARVWSKNEIFRILELEGDVYLLLVTSANHNCISVILSGERNI